MLLAAGSFLKQRPDWDSLPRVNKTWAAWNTTFCSHQLTLEREKRATGERGGVFGSAAATISIHGITAATATTGALITPDALVFLAASGTATTPAGDFALQALNGHLDQMADAATNSGLTLFQLTDANVRLAATTSTQYQNIRRPDWDSLPRVNKTWAAWNTTFCSHQLTLEREKRATGERGGVFGSAAATISIHGITAATATTGALITPDALVFLAASGTATTPAGDFALQALNGHLDQMADAATNSGLTLFQLTDANVRLAATTSTQYQNIRKVLTDIKLSSSCPNPRLPSTGARAGATGDEQTIKLLQVAIKISGSSAGSAPPTDGK